MSRELHISSLLIHARPEMLAAVSERIVDHGCEIHGQSDIGKLVVTLESESETRISEILTKLQLLPGVLAATLVFHHVETLSDPQGAGAHSTKKPEGNEDHTCP